MKIESPALARQREHDEEKKRDQTQILNFLSGFLLQF